MASTSCITLRSLGLGLLTLSALSHAQTEPPVPTGSKSYPPVEVVDTPLEYRQFEKVEITGSAILAKEAKEALPLQVIQRRDIERSGISSLPDLLHQLPLMVNFQEQGNMTGTSKGGPEGAAIHGYQSGTLVLLNGRRLPYYGSQTIAGDRAIVDLNFIPLVAVERIEILTDGASSRYGSDAIAGVINIITKADLQGLYLTAEHTAPQGGVAQGKQFSLSWGKGKIQRDGYNLQVHFTAQHQAALLAGDRDIASNSIHPFTVNGKPYLNSIETTQFFSLYGAPGYNVLTNGVIHNTYLDQYGHCPPGNYTVSSGEENACYVNKQPLYTIYPETDKKNLYLRAEKRLNGHWTGFSELVLARNSQTSVPSGYNEFDNVFPDGQIAFMTAVPLDVRHQRYQNRMHHAVVGVRGQWAGWSVLSSLSEGRHQVVREDLTGRLSKTANLGDLVLTPEETRQNPDQYTAETLAKFDLYRSGRVLRDQGVTTMRGWESLASREIGETDNGPVTLGLGLSTRSESVDYSSPDAPIYRPSFSGKRHNSAVFGELQTPLTENLEATLSARRDQYSDFGGVTTHKVGWKWKTSDTLFFRGSWGTGFRAPTLGQLTPELTLLENFFKDGVWLPLYFRGNPDLKPETSQQVNLGFRLEPSRQWSVGLDWWNLKISNTFGFINSHQLEANPVLFNEALTENNTLVTPNINLGNSRRSGIDYDLQWRRPSDWGLIRLSLKGTYFLQAERQFSDSSPYLSELGTYSAVTNAVTPRHQVVFRGVLDQGHWSTTAAVNYRSGNTETTQLADAAYTLNGFGEIIPFERKVPAYWTLDLGARWNVQSNMVVSATLNNALNKTPPLRLSSSGVLEGVDTRYANYYGRTLKIKAEFKF